MKILGIQSSPNTDGLTSCVIRAVLKGVKAQNEDTELVNLNSYNIKSCIACERGWGKCRKEGNCILEDDFQNLREKIVSSDALVLASPVYFHDISESARIFLHRLLRCEYYVDFKTFASKKAIGITSAGGSGTGAVRALLNLEYYLRRLGFEIFDLVSVTRFSKNHKIRILKTTGTCLIRDLQL